MFLTALSQLSVSFLACNNGLTLKNKNESYFSINCEFLVRHKINDRFLLWNLFLVCSARGHLMLCSHVLFRFKQNFRNFQHSEWSNNKCSLTELSRTGQEIFGSRTGRTDLDLAPNISALPCTQSIGK